MNSELRFNSIEFESGKISVFEYKDYLLKKINSLNEKELRCLSTAICDFDNGDEE